MSTRRNHQRAAVSAEVVLFHQSGGDTTATLRDISQSEAHIETETQFSIGDQINLDIPDNEANIPLKVVRATTAGYGLQFMDVLGERLCTPCAMIAPLDSWLGGHLYSGQPRGTVKLTV